MQIPDPIRLTNKVPNNLLPIYWHWTMGVYLPSLNRFSVNQPYFLSSQHYSEVLDAFSAVYDVKTDTDTPCKRSFALHRHDFPHCSGMKPYELDRYADRFRIQHALYQPKPCQKGVLVLDASGDERFVAPFPHNSIIQQRLHETAIDLMEFGEVTHIKTHNYLVTELVEKVSCFRKIVSETNSLMTFLPFCLPKTLWCDFSASKKLLKYFRTFSELNSRRVCRVEILAEKIPTASQIAKNLRIEKK